MATEPDATSEQPPALVHEFLRNARMAVPLGIEQIDVMLRLLAAAGDRVERILEVGCGQGLLSGAILDEHPSTRAVLVDRSEAMLHTASRQLERHASRLTFIHADFEDPAWTQSLESLTPFDAVVSGLAIHHAADLRKQALYREIFHLLKPEGVFITIEHVASATRWTESVWDDYMIDAIFGADLQASAGKTRAEVAREYYARASRSAGMLAPLEVQCDWLRAIGYENVECYFKVLELAMFGGQRPAA